MNFFNISDLSTKDIINIIDDKNSNKILTDKNIGLLFEKQSTRTRLSFTVGISNLGGNSIDLRYEDLNYSREESFEDTFSAMNCYLDGLIFRTNDHNKLIEASSYFKKPIINALSDKSHPCQILSDLLTLKQHFGTLDLQILWMGDMNNVLFSLTEAAILIEEIKLIICSPLAISQKKKWLLKSNISIVDSLKNVDLQSIDCVMTDVFISMNDETNEEKISLLMPYSVTSDLMSKTNSNSVFMHCLPAKLGYEVSKDVMKSPKSIVWKQAYNRMIAQNKLLKFIYQ